MILQIVPTEIEGMFWWIIIVTVLATVAIAILRSLVGSVVDFFLVKKSTARKEIRTFSMIFFVFLVGFILIFFQDPIGSFVTRESSEIAFAGLWVIIVSILIAGLTYRKGAKKAIDRVKRK